MESRTLKLLEFDRIKKILQDFCVSQEGSELIDIQDFFYSEEKLDSYYDLVDDAKKIIQSDIKFPFSELPPVKDIIPVCRKEGTVLDGTELYSLCSYYFEVAKIKNQIVTSELPDVEGIKEEISGLPDLSGLAGQIFSVLDSSGNVRENHPELRKLRKGLSELNSRVSSLSASYINENRSLFQADVPTQKDGRIVLPLKSNFKGRVKGIIHDISAKGTTVYIEPFDILELNNRIAIQEHDIQMIVAKILKELTHAVHEEIDAVSILVDRFSYLDAILARARFADRFSCSRPAISNNSMNLKSARHILLEGEIVPVNIEMDSSLNLLIITGPNAGGKTVTIKTAGLLALMNQFGMMIPAEEGSYLPVFEGVFADIGDDQSIEASLSTFSGHMKNIASILDKSNSGTLVLLDELGSGTDPGEGAAIAMAVLDALVENGSIVLTTSHHGLLKNYGYTRERVMNASMEFDEGTHSSTYRVVPGMPGDSHAIDIARNSGLPESIVSKAQNYLEDEKSEVSSMIRELERKHTQADRKEKEIAEREKQLREEIRQNDLNVLKLRQQENELRRKSNKDASRFLSEARKTLENLVKEIKEGELTKEKTKKVKEFISDIDDHINNEKEYLEETEVYSNENIDPDEIKPGMDVLVGEFRRTGTVVRKDKKNKWIINTGTLKISVDLKEIFPAPEKNVSHTFGVSLSSVKASNVPDFSLDLRGFRLEEAIEALHRQIDNALMSGLSEFSIIHGKGEGVLSSGLRNFLKNTPAVTEFRFAHPEDGGFGKTIVKLRD